MFKGTMTALVTPFKNGLVDTEAFNQFLDFQIQSGVDAVVPMGTTGECATLTNEEHIRVIELVIRRAKGKTKVIAGTGSNCTAEAIAMTQKAQDLGADGALLVTPYYNKPSQEGLYQHYMAIAKSVEIPLVLYSVPGRTGVEIGIETMRHLARDAKNIVAIKEAGGSVDRCSQLRQVLPESFSILSGDDSLTVPFMSLGAVGIISVASNVMPVEVKKMVDAAAKGDFALAENWHRRLYPLFRDLFIETNPVPTKTTLAAMGRMSEECRLPLSPMMPDNKEKLMTTLKSLNLIS